MNYPDPNSNRTAKRNARGITTDSPVLTGRKHQRAQRRSNEANTYSFGKLKPGEKAELKYSQLIVHFAGSIKYH